MTYRERFGSAWSRPASATYSAGVRADNYYVTIVNGGDVETKAVVLLVIAVAVTLLAQFPLEPLADRNDLAHWIQHGLIFWGGVGVGVAIIALYRQGQRRV